ncbi:MAG: FtsX-like permease family protein [Planctomycetes bacterium]|nr:FtsX-like permease family protein [Planctomycetota bacterium]MCB9902913.1 FtsX-like permease family protein [Planctomycetota bacterium]
MILRALWLRPMRSQPVRALATVFGVAIGVASVISTLLASRAAVASLSEDVEVVAGAATLEITRPGGVDLDDFASLRELAGIAHITPVIEGTALVPRLEDMVRVFGVDLLTDSAMRPLELDAPDERAAREAMLLGTGCTLSRELASELGVAPGDELEIVVNARPRKLEVAALFSGGDVPTAFERLVVVDVATASELYARGGTVDRVELRPRDGVTTDEVVAAAERVMPGDYRTAPASTRADDGRRMVQSLDFNLTALSGVSVLVAVVLVATTLATSVVQRRKQIALLRSLGASRRQLALAVLSEAAAIGFVGGVLGVLLGWLGARAALESVRATVASVVSDAIAGDVALDPRWALLGLALGLGASVLASVLPMREALRTPPVQALAGEHPESVARRSSRARLALAALLLVASWLLIQLPPWGDRPIWALLAALCLLATMLVLSAPIVDFVSGIGPRVGARFVAPLRLAQAALESGRRRAAWAAGAVGVAVALAVSMTTMVGSFRSSVLEWTEQSLSADLNVQSLSTASGAHAGGLDEEVVQAAIRVFGAEAVDRFHQATARVNGEAVALAGASMDVVARHGGVPFLDGRASRDVFAEAVARHGAIVNEPFMRRFDLGRGDFVRLEAPGGVIEREIVGVYRDYSGHTGRVVLGFDEFHALYPDTVAHSLAIFLHDDVDPAAARARFLAELGGRFELLVRNQRELQAEVLRVFERTFAVTIALQLVASVVAALAVVTVLGALVQERRRELAVLRSVGASQSQLAAVVLGESLLLGLAGALGGALIGLVVGWVLVAVVNLQSFGWSLAFAPPMGAVLITAGAVIPACLFAGVLPAWSVAVHAPREVLRELA